MYDTTRSLCMSGRTSNAASLEPCFNQPGRCSSESNLPAGGVPGGDLLGQSDARVPWSAAGRAIKPATSRARPSPVPGQVMAAVFVAEIVPVDPRAAVRPASAACTETGTMTNFRDPLLQG